jgi:glyoxylase-like metal-dependent hydrolase (beta-lactamase superfamily II)/rhodanese-related sulfurtransferase
MTFSIITIDTPTLGDRSYLVHDGTNALVIDPQRDIDRVLAEARSARVQIRAVFETHIHNDYVTGGLALARTTGASYYVNADDDVAFDRVPIRDGDVVPLGDQLSLQAVLTPGHTFTHLSYLLRIEHAEPTVVAAFTGGSLLIGAVGRPDLVGPSSTRELASAQFHSAHRLAQIAPDEAQLLPTHGFGSFCSTGQSDVDASTIGREKAENSALTSDEEAFVEDLLAGLDAYPSYYAHMGPRNLDAPDSAPDLTPPTTADPAELRRRLAAGEWVVDLRTRTAFAAGHVPGTFNFGLDGSMATYLGWTIPWQTPLTLIGESAAQVAQAQRELVRIGIDRVAAAAVGTPEELSAPAAPATLPRATFADLEPARAHRPDLVVLDVRRRNEWHESHVEGAVHLPLHDLVGRIDDVPDGQVWVHCGSGYRAAIAASMLAAAGRDAVIIDDEWTNATSSGVRVVTGNGDPR